MATFNNNMGLGGGGFSGGGGFNERTGALPMFSEGGGGMFTGSPAERDPNSAMLYDASPTPASSVNSVGGNQTQPMAQPPMPSYNAFTPQQSMYQGTNFGQSAQTQNLANALTTQSNQNLSQNVMPQISQGAQLAGQYGGSRQGVAQGIAAGNAQAGLDLAKSQLYSSAYGQDQNFYLGDKNATNSYNLGNKTADQNYFLGNKTADNSYALGNKTADQNYYLGNQGQMQNFYTQQRGQDQSGIALGANLYGQGNNGNLGIGAGQYQLGQTYMNAPLTAAQNYAGIVNPYSGLGGSSTTGGGSSSTSTTTNSGNPGTTSGGGLQGALGGALAGWQAGSNFGLG